MPTPPSDDAKKAGADSDLAQRLAAAIGRHERRRIEVRSCKRLTGGASRATYMFEAVSPDGSARKLVLRASPVTGGVAPSADNMFMGPGWAAEAEVLRAAARAQVPVPPVLMSLAPADGLGEGFIMGFVEGETLARRILRDDIYAEARARMARQCGEIIGRIHAIAPETLPTLQRVDNRAHIDFYRQRLAQWSEPMPVLELGLRWLEERCPPAGSEPLRVVHGDFRNGNFIVGPEGIRAVLDWEIVHIGDPYEDLSWISTRAWRFGVFSKPVGGFGEREDLLAGYEAVAGRKVDRARVRYWEVFGSLKWGIMCLMMGMRHMRSEHGSLEHAAIARRVAENEHDLLELIEQEGI